MENYSIILAQFTEIGFSQSSMLDEYGVYKALDELCQKNTKNGEIFNRELAQQIFEQTHKVDEQEVIIKDFISTILEAHILLKKYIYDHRQKIKITTDEGQHDELVKQLQQYEDDYSLLTQPFLIQNRLKSEAAIPDSRVSKSSNFSDFFADSPKIQNESQSLKITFVIASAFFLIEFLLMFQKHHFLSMLAYVAVLSIFLLNYFDKTYIRITLYILGASIFLDFLWVLLQSDHFWNVDGASQHSSQHTGYLRFVYIMAIIAMLVKAIITYLLFKYRSNSPETRKTVRLLSFRFDLSAEMPSPLSTLVLKTL